MTATFPLRSPRIEISPALLASHIGACARARGRWFNLECLAERVHAFMAPRFFTAVFAATGIFGLLAIWT